MVFAGWYSERRETQERKIVCSNGKFVPPSSSVTVKHGPCLLTLERDKKKREDLGFRNQAPEETSPHLLLGTQDQRLGAEQDQLPCGSTGTSSGDCQMTETCRAPWRMGDVVLGRGHASRWTTYISAHTRTAYKDHVQKRLEEDLC